jgi:hypothetical protein
MTLALALSLGWQATAAPASFRLTRAVERQVLGYLRRVQGPVNVIPVGRASVATARRLEVYFKAHGAPVALTPLTDLSVQPGSDHPINFTPKMADGFDAAVWVDVSKSGGPNLP